MRAAWVIATVTCLVGSALVGCSSEEAASGGGIESRSGSRIKVRSWRSDEIEVFDGLFDSELEVACTFRPAADGQLRCLPGPSNVSVIFSDASCQEPLGYGYSSCEVDSFTTDSSLADECGGKGPEVYRVGDEISQPDAGYQRLSDGSCEELTLEDASYFAVERVAPTALVSAKREIAPRNEKLGVEMLAGRDGSRVRGSLYDLARDTACSLTTVGPRDDEHAYCVGATAYSVGDFSDEGCSEPVAVNYTCDTPEAVVLFKVANQTDDGVCFETELYEVGEEASRSSIFYGGLLDDSCAKNEDPYADYSFLSLGKPLSASKLVELTETQESDGRLVLRQYTNDGTNIAPNGVLWDNELAAECSVLSVSEKEGYCVPDYASFDDTTYADAACTRGVFIQSKSSSCGEPTKPVRYIVDQLSSDPECLPSRAHAIYAAEKFEASLYYVADEQGFCTETLVDTDNEYYVAGDEVPLDETFVKLTYSTDE